MAFSTLRGRPRKPCNDNDPGTPELRLKHALRLTAEPIDLCLEKKLITPSQHWSGLHLRWLYTLRYGAPSLTIFYADSPSPARGALQEDPAWRALREKEYAEAVMLLKTQRRYECTLRLCVYNESPAFLDARLLRQAANQPALATRLLQAHAELREGLRLLAHHWQRRPTPSKRFETATGNENISV